MFYIIFFLFGRSCELHCHPHTWRLKDTELLFACCFLWALKLDCLLGKGKGKGVGEREGRGRCLKLRREKTKGGEAYGSIHSITTVSLIRVQEEMGGACGT